MQKLAVTAGKQAIPQGESNPCSRTENPLSTVKNTEKCDDFARPTATAHATPQIGAADSDLSTLIAAWPTLPPAIKAGIVAMVKAAVASS